jgi:hypothetical protein
MSHQSKVRISNSTGSIMTSAKQAVRLISAGRARYVDEHTIELLPLALDCSSDCSTDCSKVRQSPSPSKVVEFQPDAFQGQTFLHYPQSNAFKKAA